MDTTWVEPLIAYARVEHEQFDVWEDLVFLLLAAFPDRRVFRLPENQEQVNRALIMALSDADKVVLARTEAMAKKPSKDPDVIQLRDRRDKIKRKLRYQMHQLEVKLYGARLSDVGVKSATTVTAETCALCADAEACVTTECCQKKLLCNHCYCNVILQRFGVFVCPFCRNADKKVTVPERAVVGKYAPSRETVQYIDGEEEDGEEEANADEEGEETEAVLRRQSTESARASRAARASRRSSARDSVTTVEETVDARSRGRADKSVVPGVSSDDAASEDVEEEEKEDGEGDSGNR